MHSDSQISALPTWKPTPICKVIPPLFCIQPFIVEHLLKEAVNWQWSCWQSFCPQSLVDSSPPNMPLTTFPKHSKKLCCVRTASGFTDVKDVIYFQPLSLPSYLYHDPTMASFPSHQKPSLTSSSLVAFQKQQAQQKPSLCTHRNSQMVSLGQAQPTGSSCWRQQKYAQCQELSFLILFSTWFAAEQTSLSTDILSEQWSQMHGFCYSEMLPFHLINLHLLSDCFQ